MDKCYIESQYNSAMLDLKHAATPAEQSYARRYISHLEALASEMFGIDYAASLKKLPTI